MSDHADITGARPLGHRLRSAAIAGVALAAVAGIVIAAVWLSRPGARRPSEAATTAFLAAWQAHLSTSWSVDEVERRATAKGANIGFQIHEAQRPPDSVYVAGGTISARRGQTLIACATAPGAAAPSCREQPTTQTWAQGVTAQISQLRQYLVGPKAVYSVTDLGGDCYQLSVRNPEGAGQLPVFLDRGAKYCFDRSTNAVRLSVITRVGATDTTTAVTMRAPARDADLALPSGARYEG